MERTGAAVDPPTQCSVEMKPPSYPSTTLPKKNPDQKLFVIKLPLDIDISIHHHHRTFILFVALPWIILFFLVLYLKSSHQQQLQVYEKELAALRIQSSQLSMQSFELQNQLSQVESVCLKAASKAGKSDKTHRRKRDTGDGQYVSQIAKYTVSPADPRDTSNDTMRGSAPHSIFAPCCDAGSVRAAHFKGLLPEKLVEGGQIGPWYEDKQAVGEFGLSNCNLRDRGVKLIVNETGLYLIYAQVYLTYTQVYYLATKSLNSYSINVYPGNKSSASIPVAFCSTNASVNDQAASEVSCFTSIVRKLNAGDGIALQQLERQRRLVMRDGRTFMGLVRLG